MNDPVRRLSAVILIMFLALMTAASWIQVVSASSLNADGRNVRTLYREYGNFRGPFIIDGERIAYSAPVADPYNYLRSYSDGDLYAAATGYYSIVFGRSGLEQTENQLLNGTADSLFWSRLGDLFAGREQEGASVELTIRSAIQRVARDALGDQRGAVIALDPRTGAVLAMVTSPTFDPAALATHNTSDANDAYSALLSDASGPLVNRTINGDTYPPGSTFKLVVAAAALDAGYTPDTQIYAPRELKLPQSTRTLRNYGGSACSPTDSMTLANALRISCNTAFASLGMSLGWGVVERKALEFGWRDEFQIPLIVTPSGLPSDIDDARTAQSSIGQYDVRATPLQMAMVSAAIANGGTLMTPYLVRNARAADLRVISESTPTAYGIPLTTAQAADLTEMMIGVVNAGSGVAARIPGVSVAGKTGTAETGRDEPPHAWFTGFAPADNPVVAVAVIVENGGNLGSEATGGRVAAPIARQVMEAAIALDKAER